MTTQDAEIVRLDGSPIHYSRVRAAGAQHRPLRAAEVPLLHVRSRSRSRSTMKAIRGGSARCRRAPSACSAAPTIERVVMVDATTGECQDLAIEEVPQWVDHAYPTDLLIEQYNWSGAYKDGWLNSWLGQRKRGADHAGHRRHAGLQLHRQGRRRVGVHRRHVRDGGQLDRRLRADQPAHRRIALLLGARAPPRTSAMESAEGQVQNLRYQATFPLLINVGGQPTYFMALKDNAGPGEAVRNARYPALSKRRRGRHGRRLPGGIRGAARHQRRAAAGLWRRTPSASRRRRAPSSASPMR